MSELDKLKAAVEAEEEGYIVEALAAKVGVIGYEHAADVRYAHSKDDLNAARRLQKALLPGWTWALQNDAANVIFSKAEVDRVWDIPVYSAECPDTPARSWLLAILRAVRATKP